jgi:hypothetical protein
MDIYFSTIDRKKIMTIPIIPETLPEIAFSQKNEEYETMKGSINLLGMEGLFNFSLQSFFPVKPYEFSKTKIDGWEYVRFFNKIKNNRELLRLTISHQKTDVVNNLVTIESFSYSIDQSGDIQYKLDVKQFKNF